MMWFTDLIIYIILYLYYTMGNVSYNIDAKDLHLKDPGKDLIQQNTTIGENKIPIQCYAVRGRHKVLFDYLIANVTFNVYDAQGDTPLHYAASLSSSYYMKKILQVLNTQYPNQMLRTPLLVAVLHHRYDYIRPLRFAMYDYDKSGYGPIHYAIQQRDKRMIKLLISLSPPLPKHWVFTMCTPKEYHLNYFPNVESLPPLSMALQNLDFELVDMLVRLGADIDAVYNGKSPKDHMVIIGSTLRYGGVFPTKTCTTMDVQRMWGILTRDTDVHRNTGGDMSTGLLSGEYKYF